MLQEEAEENRRNTYVYASLVALSRITVGRKGDDRGPIVDPLGTEIRAAHDRLALAELLGELGLERSTAKASTATTMTKTVPPARVRDINAIVVGTPNFASLGGLGVGIMSVIGRCEQERRYLVARENRRRWPENALPTVTNLMNRRPLHVVLALTFQLPRSSTHLNDYERTWFKGYCDYQRDRWHG